MRVKKHPVIYDMTHPNNRDSFIKEKTWRQIAITVNAGSEYDIALDKRKLKALVNIVFDIFKKS